jgi:hypothetical protein
MKKENPKLKNPVYTENLLTCASILCGCISRVLIDNKDLTERLTIYTGVIPAYIALRESIGRIIEEETETVDKNQLKLEL